MPAGAAIASFVASPVPALVLGVLLGAAMLVVTARSVRFATPEMPELGVARAVAFSSLGLFAAFGALLLYFLFAREGLVAFGVGLVGGFLVPAFVALFKFSGIGSASTGGGR